MGSRPPRDQTMGPAPTLTLHSPGWAPHCCPAVHTKEEMLGAPAGDQAEDAGKCLLVGVRQPGGRRLTALGSLFPYPEQERQGSLHTGAPSLMQRRVEVA